MEQPYIPYIPCTATVGSTSSSWQVASVGPRSLACEEINTMVIEEIVSQGDGARVVSVGIPLLLLRLINKLLTRGS
jgi:hypothetical protein